MVRSNTEHKHKSLKSLASLLGPFPEQNLEDERQQGARLETLLCCRTCGLGWLKCALCFSCKDHSVLKGARVDVVIIPYTSVSLILFIASSQALYILIDSSSNPKRISSISHNFVAEKPPALMFF